jgi:triacylglycerol lipase
MRLLTPDEAAAIARGVYRLREDSVSTVTQERGQLLGCEELFAVADDGRFEARSGGLLWKQLSGFGYVATGMGSFAGDLLIATRGTQTKSDWCSNLNIALQQGPAGLPVHAGFNEIWKSFAPELRSMLRGRNPTRVHCVGHSLGGALATLNADLLSAGHVAEVVLYTFGAPRAGDGLFARSLTQRLTPDNIFRVSHPADPVPMIPLFPFWHLPFGSDGLTIANTSNALISVDAHLMPPSYLPGVQGRSWHDLRSANAQAGNSQQVKNWLEQAAEGRGGFLMGSAKLLSMIGRALTWLLAKAGKLVMGGVGVALAGGATLLDQLAWLLTQAAQLSKEVGVQIKGLIGAIFSFLGRKALQGIDVTVAFLRWVLELLFSSLRSLGERALALIR